MLRIEALQLDTPAFRRVVTPRRKRLPGAVELHGVDPQIFETAAFAEPAAEFPDPTHVASPQCLWRTARSPRLAKLGKL